MRIKANTSVALAIVVTFFSCALRPTNADAGDRPWRIRVFGLSMNPTGDTVVVPDTGERIPYDVGVGYRL